MPSSTSSSDGSVGRDRTLPAGIGGVFLAGLLLGAVSIGALEIRLRQVGVEPDVRDGVHLWAAARERASTLGSEAVVLIGGSRVQLGVDLDVLGRELDGTPVQLAIDGANFRPVLHDLARDPTIRGTVIVSATAWTVTSAAGVNRSREWIDFYHREFRGLLSPRIEAALKAHVQQRSSLYSSEIPIERMPGIVGITTPPPSGYVRTLASREQSADYQLVRMPEFYMGRVARHTKAPVGRAFRGLPDFERQVGDYIASRPEGTCTTANLEQLRRGIRAIEGRGGRVIFVRFPTSGLVWAYDERTLPRARCWDEIVRSLGVPSIHFRDDPRLQVATPDGSHLDRRVKAPFSQALGRRIAAIVDEG